MRPVHWIETELARHFEDLDLTRGVDLDRNDKIKGSERTDQNGDGDVDSAEWQKFTGDNRAALERLGGHFKTYFSAGSAFKPDNPIHDLLSIESELASPADVNKAYKKVEEILGIVKERLSEAELTPQEKLKLVYDAMKQLGIEFGQPGQSFVCDINKKALDCDTSSFVVLAVAHELNWPIYLVRVPEHTFVRWDDHKGNRFNMDYGRIRPDEFYIKKFDISHREIEQGIHLKNMDYDEVLSHFYTIRGIAKDRLGRLEEAIKNYDRAIELDSNVAQVYYNRGNAKRKLGRYEEAIKDYDKAIALNPNFAKAYSNRGTLKLKLGRHEEAIKNYDRAIELDSNVAQVYYNRGTLKLKLGRHEEAIKDFDKAIELDPKNAKAHYNLEIAKSNLGSCSCNAPGLASQKPSDRSFLSLIMMLVFD